MKISGVLLACLLIPIVCVSAQTFGSIDVQHYTFSITLNDGDNNIKGKAEIKTHIEKQANMIAFDLAGVDAQGKGMKVTSVTADEKAVRFKQVNDKLNIYASAQANTTHTYIVTYLGVPADGLIISTNKYGDRTFFGDNWLRRARKWLPCNDDVADKAGVDFIVIAPAHYSVVANGTKLSEKQLGGVKTTHWHEAVPISTKVMVIGVADLPLVSQLM